MLTAQLWLHASIIGAWGHHCSKEFPYGCSTLIQISLNCLPYHPSQEQDKCFSLTYLFQFSSDCHLFCMIFFWGILRKCLFSSIKPWQPIKASIPCSPLRSILVKQLIYYNDVQRHRWRNSYRNIGKGKAPFQQSTAVWLILPEICIPGMLWTTCRQLLWRVPFFLPDTVFCLCNFVEGNWQIW